MSIERTGTRMKPSGCDKANKPVVTSSNRKKIDPCLAAIQFVSLVSFGIGLAWAGDHALYFFTGSWFVDPSESFLRSSTDPVLVSVDFGGRSCHVFSDVTWDHINDNCSAFDDAEKKGAFFLEPAVSEELRSCVVSHPSLNFDLAVSGPMSNGNFGGTRGLMARFNLKGIREAREEAALACLMPLFDRIRDPASNAFVLNVLDCGPNSSGVGWHVDQSVAIIPDTWAPMHTAHTVSVWYASIPSDMDGGELEIVAYDGGRDGKIKQLGPFNSTPNEGEEISDGCDGLLKRNKPVGLTPNSSSLLTTRARVIPREGALVTFRGDAFHRVLPLRSSHVDTSRISIVLEQYRIDPMHYGKTLPYEFTGGLDES